MQKTSLSFPKDKHPLNTDVNSRVVEIAAQSGHKIYLVGGYVRDLLIETIHGESSAKKMDFDYAVANGSAFSLAKAVSDAVEGHFVPLDEDNDTARVVTDAAVIDFAGCVGGGIESDIKRRDFTVNAIAWDPLNPDSVIDIVGGVEDIRAKRLRGISENAFIDDPLRLLRAYRFAATLAFQVDEQTKSWVFAHKDKLRSVAAERINVELFGFFASNLAGSLIWDFAESGLLEIIFPELTECRRVTPNDFHHLGLFDHSLETIPQFEARLADTEDWVKESISNEISPGVSRVAATKVACILHDIGKPSTWIITDEGRHTFHTHDKVGADMTLTISERLKWSKATERFIADLVRWHLRPGALYHNGMPTEKAIRRFYRSINDELPELMLLAFADMGATRGAGFMGESRENLEKSLLGLLAGYPPYKEEAARMQRLLNGRELMVLLGLKPGPVVGELLAALEDAQVVREVSNRTEAEDFVKRLYEKKYCR